MRCGRVEAVWNGFGYAAPLSQSPTQEADEQRPFWYGKQYGSYRYQYRLMTESSYRGERPIMRVEHDEQEATEEMKDA